MSWTKDETSGDILKLGGEAGMATVVGGRFTDRRSGRNDSFMPVLTQRDGTVVVIGSYSVITDKMQESRMGQLVLIKYLGDERGKNNTYRNFDVFWHDGDADEGFTAIENAMKKAGTVLPEPAQQASSGGWSKEASPIGDEPPLDDDDDLPF